MSILNEADYEQSLIKKLVTNGFSYIKDEEIFQLRQNKLTNVVLESHLIDFLIKTNNVPKEHLHEIIKRLNSVRDSSDVERANAEFHKLLVDGVKVRDEKQQMTISYRLIDFDNVNNNIFVVTNQFTITSNHPNYNNQRPDIVIYVNGLPLVVFELKSPELKHDDGIGLAFNQISNYIKWIPDLFYYNAFNVISDGITSKFGSLTSSYSRYQYWRGEKFDTDSRDGLQNDLFKPGVLLDVIKNYTFIIEDSKSVKKIISSYHQYYGVKDAIESIEKAINTSTGKGGIFWHTQGSGKSFSMMFLTKNFSKIEPGTTYVVVTDRNDLDDQLFESFKKAEIYLNQKVDKIESIDELQSKLKNIMQDGVYFTTIQKFVDTVGELSDRKNIVVITDEAHRSHNNIEGKITFSENEWDMVEKFGNAKYLRDAFPNATFIGFTGTPIENDDKSTSDIFGRVLENSKYLMIDAERDGVVVPIKYESRMPKLHLKEDVLKEIDDYIYEKMAEIDKTSIAPSEVRKKINKISQKLENFIKDPERLVGIAEDFVKHYEMRMNVVNGKAMFVAYDRHVALQMRRNILAIRPEWENKIKLVVTNSNNQSDDPELILLSGTSKYRKELAREFKDDSSEFKIAIVVDMWLTGFDVPSLDILYLDKPTKMHNLMQTIARTNRVYSNKETGIKKECGVIVDYIGVWTKLRDALAFYSGSTTKDTEIHSDINVIKNDYLKLLDQFYKNYIRETKLDFDLLMSDRTTRMDVVKNIYDEVLRSSTPEDKRIEGFIVSGKALAKHFKEIISVLSPLEKFKYNLVLVARSFMIKVALEAIDFTKITQFLTEKLDNAIDYKNTEIVDEINGNAIKLSEILNFILTSNDPRKHLDADLKVSAVRQVIEELKVFNIVQSRKLSDSLKQLMAKYEAGYITLEELMKGIYLIANDASSYSSDGTDKETGYSREELAFYHILMRPVGEQSAYDVDMIKKIMTELLKIVNNKTMVNSSWMYNDKMVINVRSQLKKLLNDFDYPDTDKAQKELIEQIMYQIQTGRRG